MNPSAVSGLRAKKDGYTLRPGQPSQAQCNHGEPDWSPSGCGVRTNHLLKDHPSLNEMGLRGFAPSIWHGLCAPKGTPDAVLKQRNDAFKLALRDPKFIQIGIGGSHH